MHLQEHEKQPVAAEPAGAAQSAAPAGSRMSQQEQQQQQPQRMPRMYSTSSTAAAAGAPRALGRSTDSSSSLRQRFYWDVDKDEVTFASSNTDSSTSTAKLHASAEFSQMAQREAEDPLPSHILGEVVERKPITSGSTIPPPYTGGSSKFAASRHPAFPKAVHRSMQQPQRQPVSADPFSAEAAGDLDTAAAVAQEAARALGIELGEIQQALQQVKEKMAVSPHERPRDAEEQQQGLLAAVDGGEEFLRYQITLQRAAGSTPAEAGGEAPEAKIVHLPAGAAFMFDSREAAKLQWTDPVLEEGPDAAALLQQYENQKKEQQFADAAHGLHHHGRQPEAAGYTLEESVMLAHSAAPAQRALAVRTLGQLVLAARALCLFPNPALSPTSPPGEKGEAFAALRKLLSPLLPQRQPQNQQQFVLRGGFGFGLGRFLRFLFLDEHLLFRLCGALMAESATVAAAAAASVANLLLPIHPTRRIGPLKEQRLLQLLLQEEQAAPDSGAAAAVYLPAVDTSLCCAVAKPFLSYLRRHRKVALAKPSAGDSGESVAAGGVCSCFWGMSDSVAADEEPALFPLGGVDLLGSDEEQDLVRLLCGICVGGPQQVQQILQQPELLQQLLLLADGLLLGGETRRRRRAAAMKHLLPVAEPILSNTGTTSNMGVSEEETDEYNLDEQRLVLQLLLLLRICAIRVERMQHLECLFGCLELEGIDDSSSTSGTTSSVLGLVLQCLMTVVQQPQLQLFEPKQKKQQKQGRQEDLEHFELLPVPSELNGHLLLQQLSSPSNAAAGLSTSADETCWSLCMEHSQTGSTDGGGSDRIREKARQLLRFEGELVLQLLLWVGDALSASFLQASLLLSAASDLLASLQPLQTHEPESCSRLATAAVWVLLRCTDAARWRHKDGTIDEEALEAAASAPCDDPGAALAAAAAAAIQGDTEKLLLLERWRIAMASPLHLLLGPPGGDVIADCGNTTCSFSKMGYWGAALNRVLLLFQGCKGTVGEPPNTLLSTPAVDETAEMAQADWAATRAMRSVAGAVSSYLSETGWTLATRCCSPQTRMQFPCNCVACKGRSSSSKKPNTTSGMHCSKGAACSTWIIPTTSESFAVVSADAFQAARVAAAASLLTASADAPSHEAEIGASCQLLDPRGVEMLLVDVQLLRGICEAFSACAALLVDVGQEVDAKPSSTKGASVDGWGVWVRESSVLLKRPLVQRFAAEAMVLAKSLTLLLETLHEKLRMPQQPQQQQGQQQGERDLTPFLHSAVISTAPTLPQDDIAACALAALDAVSICFRYLDSAEIEPRQQQAHRELSLRCVVAALANAATTKTVLKAFGHLGVYLQQHECESSSSGDTAEKAKSCVPLLVADIEHYLEQGKQHSRMTETLDSALFVSAIDMMAGAPLWGALLRNAADPVAAARGRISTKVTQHLRRLLLVQSAALGHAVSRVATPGYCMGGLLRCMQLQQETRQSQQQGQQPEPVDMPGDWLQEWKLFDVFLLQPMGTAWVAPLAAETGQPLDANDSAAYAKASDWRKAMQAAADACAEDAIGGGLEDDRKSTASDPAET
ncbi:hypothetical protein cyc_05820 [Cyclospora cayetanensis]|uniref:RPAP1 C-terminal domain-containing protein n=1 Tax=Cyclospora cayetanensis TaxID=88456 RepID=A0A1D3CZ45_9EIME|nr:hypothetical protein cyc_05820 [Cyclospora cayetanensis]